MFGKLSQVVPTWAKRGQCPRAMFHLCRMSTNLNKHRLNNLLKGISVSISHFESQGHAKVYFTAQFYRAGKKQNGIDRGDVSSFAKQVRTYVTSEEADSARIDFVSEETGKSIYSKVIDNLRVRESEKDSEQPQQAQRGFQGFGEAQLNELVDRRVDEQRRRDEFERLGKEVEELRSKNEKLEVANDELHAKVEAKSQMEFYSGLIGAAFPGLAAMLGGTPLGQAASFLAGTGAISGPELAEPTPEASEAQGISALVAEFCETLNAQELGAVHLLFVAFEADRAKIQSALQFITANGTLSNAA